LLSTIHLAKPGNMMLQCKLVEYSDNEDVESLLSLLDHYAKDPMGGGSGLSDFAKSSLAGALANFPGAFSVIGRFDGKAVALANCFMGFSTFQCKPIVNIHDLVVHADYRGRGFGEPTDGSCANRGDSSWMLQNNARSA
jgi:GNAT superfamily N-acetyltransferase